jgi:hypothetical protein
VGSVLEQLWGAERVGDAAWEKSEVGEGKDTLDIRT